MPKFLSVKTFKKFIASTLITSLLLNPIAFATSSYIEVDSQESEAADRLHTIMPLSNVRDISHIEIDPDEQRVRVYRDTETAEDNLDPETSSASVRESVLDLSRRNIYNLPWHLGQEGLVCFLSQHTAWLTPLGDDDYRLEFTGRLLGGVLEATKTHTTLDCQHRSNHAPGTLGDRYCRSGRVADGHPADRVINRPYVPAVNERWERQRDQSHQSSVFNTISLPTPAPNIPPRPTKKGQDLYQEIKQLQPLKNKLYNETRKMDNMCNRRDDYKVLIDMVFDAVAEVFQGGKILGPIQDKIISQVGVEWDEWSKGTLYFNAYFCQQAVYERGFGLLGSGRKNSFFVRKVVTAVAQAINYHVDPASQPPPAPKPTPLDLSKLYAQLNIKPPAKPAPKPAVLKLPAHLTAKPVAKPVAKPAPKIDLSKLLAAAKSPAKPAAKPAAPVAKPTVPNILAQLNIKPAAKPAAPAAKPAPKTDLSKLLAVAKPVAKPAAPTAKPIAPNLSKLLAVAKPPAKPAPKPITNQQFHGAEIVQVGLLDILGKIGGAARRGGGKPNWNRALGTKNQPSASQKAYQSIENILGKDYSTIKNKHGDTVFLSKDGNTKVRFDINHPSPHKNPHMHVEKLENGKWVKSGPIYMKDVEKI